MLKPLPPCTKFVPLRSNVLGMFDFERLDLNEISNFTRISAEPTRNQTREPWPEFAKTSSISPK